MVMNMKYRILKDFTDFSYRLVDRNYECTTEKECVETLEKLQRLQKKLNLIQFIKIFN